MVQPHRSQKPPRRWESIHHGVSRNTKECTRMGITSNPLPISVHHLHQWLMFSFLPFSCFWCISWLRISPQSLSKLVNPTFRVGTLTRSATGKASNSSSFGSWGLCVSHLFFFNPVDPVNPVRKHFFSPRRVLHSSKSDGGRTRRARRNTSRSVLYVPFVAKILLF